MIEPYNVYKIWHLFSPKPHDQLMGCKIPINYIIHDFYFILPNNYAIFIGSNIDHIYKSNNSIGNVYQYDKTCENKFIKVHKKFAKNFIEWSPKNLANILLLEENI